MKEIAKFALVTFAGIVLATSVQAQDSKIKLKNNSKWDIDHLYICPVNKLTWGKDLLKADGVLKPGESIEILAHCNTYDIKIVDKDGIECILEDIDICLAEEEWLIGDLTKCNN